MVEREKIIVSLTSFPAAIPYVVNAVRSILTGSVLPDKIVLYLTASQFPDNKIPQELLDLLDETSLFEVRFCDVDIRSYTKLIPALKDFPDAVIITIDDDMWYHSTMLRDLLRLHARFPDVIIAERARHMKTGVPYVKWKKYRWYHFLIKRWHIGFHNLQTGVGGVLYPPGALKAEMIEGGEFQELAPTTDDIWFWAAAVANGTRIMPVPFGKIDPKELGKPEKLSLKKVNLKSGVDRNRVALDRILERYPRIRERIENEK